MLRYLDQENSNDTFDPNQINEKLGWLHEHRDHIDTWGNLMNIVESAVDFVKSVGIYSYCSVDLKTEIEECMDDDRANRVRAELISFVEQQSLNAMPDEILLGSSEIIESVIGKFKTLEHDQVKSGFTSLLLSFAALVSKTIQDVIQKAVKTIPAKKISEWLKENIGQSVKSQRKEILKVARSTE
jgi:hypothetical protein